MISTCRRIKLDPYLTSYTNKSKQNSNKIQNTNKINKQKQTKIQTKVQDLNIRLETETSRENIREKFLDIGLFNDFLICVKTLAIKAEVDKL